MVRPTDKPPADETAAEIEGNPTKERSMAAARRVLALLPKCDAKTRAGTPCQRPPNRGSKRCRLHGGAKGSGRPPTSGRWTKATAQAYERARLLLALVKRFHGSPGGRRMVYAPRGNPSVEEILARLRELSGKRSGRRD
jgi:hypothetical protein